MNGSKTSLREEAARRAAEANHDSGDSAACNDEDDDDDEYEEYTSFPPILTKTKHPLERSVATKNSSGPRNSNDTSSNESHPSTSKVRQEWRQHGAGLTQVLEEKRQSGALMVRVMATETRVDLSGSNFTAYVIQVQQQTSSNGKVVTTLVEHRYSAFDKLNSLLLKWQSPLPVSFPAKHWAGRVGNWTPSLSWAPDSHDELIHSRIIQLDVWLVHLVELYNHGDLVDPVHQALTEFLLQPAKLPCQVSNDVEREKWKYYNPLSFTLAAAIRQATYTLQYMVTPNTITQSDQSIPLDLLQAAEGLCFLTVFKAGMIVSGRVGTGLVIARLVNKKNKSDKDPVRWSAPAAVGTVGMGWGALIGGDVTHYLIVLTTRQAVMDVVHSSVQVGAELGVAVGPVGRGASSQLRTGDWTIHQAYAYAHSQGLFVGMSLEGSIMSVRQDVNAKFYGQRIEGKDLLQQEGPTAAEPLYQALDQALQLEIPEGSFRPSHYLNPQKNDAISQSSNITVVSVEGVPGTSAGRRPVQRDSSL